MTERRRQSARLGLGFAAAFACSLPLAEPTAQAFTHIVAPGDTLASVAERAS